MCFKDNTYNADLTNMQVISKYKENWFLLCTIDVFNKYAWVVPLKDKKDITITNIFQKNLDKSDWKPNKI